MRRHPLLVMAALLPLAGCATVEHSALPSAGGPLQARQAQTRTFDTVDPGLVLKAALGVLQDEGFVIREVNAELGVVTAVKEWRSRQRNEALHVLKLIAALPTYGATLLVPTGRTEFTAVEANVNVTLEQQQTRARISLVARVTDQQGRLCSVTPVVDALVYQGLLARLDKAVYLQKEGL